MDREASEQQPGSGRKRRHADDTNHTNKKPRAHSRSPIRNGDSRNDRAGHRDNGPRENGTRGTGRQEAGERKNFNRAPPTGPRALANDSSNRSHQHEKAGGNQGGRNKQSSEPVTGVNNATAAFIPDIEVDPEDEELLEIQKVMGFATFKSTQNTKVPGNARNFAVRKNKQTQYRQYMNRSGGFNRPLSPSRD